MAKEIERKYIALRIPEFMDVETTIQQGYLMLVDKKQLRVRITDNKRGQICYKSCLTEEARDEYEYDIPLSDAYELWNNSDCSLSKRRWSSSNPLYKDIVIDVYPNGLMVVEIENEQPFPLPDYCGKDITGVKEYSNIYLAQATK